MSQCETNSAESGKLQIFVSEESRWSESFECAVRKRAKRCAYCGWPLTDRAVDRDGGCYCSNYCAQQADTFLRLAEEAHWSTIAIKLYRSAELFPAADER
jgi:hypothetical protein